MSKQALLITGLLTALSFSSIIGLGLPAAFADTTTPVAVVPAEGYAMMHWNTDAGIVQQMQNIHRMTQQSSPAALTSLITALQSNFPLARRKASRALVENFRMETLTPQDRDNLLKQLIPALNDTDPVVQKNIVRVFSRINTMQARNHLKSFFQKAPQDVQLMVMSDYLAQPKDPGMNWLPELAFSTSPYAPVKSAASKAIGVN